MKTTTTCFIVGLLLTAGTLGQAQTPPTITQQPTNHWASLGATATFRVVVTSDTPPAYQWRFNDADIAGAAANPLIITNVQLANAGGYSVVVTNLSGSVTSQVATLTVDSTTFTKMTNMFNDVGDTYACAWGDYDNDGWPDLIVVGGYTTGGSRTNTFLYHNNRDGSFTKITEGPIATSTDRSGACAWGDYNNDGNLDLWVGNYETQLPSFYINQGNGTFTKVQPSAEWIANRVEVRGFTMAWGDYDRDGFLDLAVGYVAADGSSTVADSLLHNNGDGSFSVVTNSPIATKGTSEEGLSWIDYNNDGEIDLFMSRPEGKNALFENVGGGAFQPVTSGVLTGFAGLAHTWGDYDNDGWLDICLTRLSGTGGPLTYRNNGDGTFTKVVLFPATLNPQGAYWVDYDNDGYLDLFFTGFPRNRLLHNQGDGTFAEVTTGSLVSESAIWYASWGDYDHNGFLDVFVVNDAKKSVLYRNNGNSNGWLDVKLEGTASNRAGIGAKVRVKATIGGKTFWQMRQIQSQTQVQELIAHFGLGDATNIDTVRIEWPSGTVQELRDMAPKQIQTVTEPARLQVLGPGSFRIQSWKGQRFEVLASADLAHWSPMTTVTNLTGTLDYIDAAAAAATQRFYRVKSL